MRQAALLMGGGLAAAGVALALAAPTGNPDAENRAASRAGGPEPQVVDCRDRVEGFRHGLPEWAKREGVAAGPLVLPGVKGVAEQPAWRYREERERPRNSLPTGRRRAGFYLAVKVLVVVRPGARITLSGPPDAVAFTYSASYRRDSLRIPGGPAAVTFAACPPGQRRFSGPGRLRFTEFAGGIAVAGPRCVPLGIRDERTGQTLTRWVSFGTRGAGCPDPVAARPVRPVTLGCGQGTPLPERALAPDWRRTSLVAGPLALVYARDLARQPRQAFWPARRSFPHLLRHELRTPAERRRARRTWRRAPPDGHGVAETMVLVEPGHTATAVVPGLARGRFALVYSRRARNAERPGAPGIVRIRDGDLAVRFGSCPGPDRTHYLGGIIARGAGCAQLDVHPDGGPPVPVRLPLGTRCR